MTIVGFILVAFGMLVLVYGGISLRYEEAWLDVGSSNAAVMGFQTLRHSPLIGAIALISGLLLLVVPRNLPTPSTARARRGGHHNHTAAPDTHNVRVPQRTLGLPAAPTRVTGRTNGTSEEQEVT